jgi:hypothetical protein
MCGVRGRREEYVGAADFVRELLRRLGFGPERSFAVPGNRDMDRKIEVVAWRALRDQIGPRGCGGLVGIADGRQAPRWIAADVLESVRAWAEAFRYWLSDLGREDLLPEASAHGRLGYRRSLTLPGLPFPVQVIRPAGERQGRSNRPIQGWMCLGGC